MRTSIAARAQVELRLVLLVFLALVAASGWLDFRSRITTRKKIILNHRILITELALGQSMQKKVFGKKILSLALMLTCLIALISVENTLLGYYRARPWRQPYSPYLLDGSLLWFAMLTAVLNIFPSRMIGKVRIGRVFFHHYVYGFLTMVISTLFIAFLIRDSVVPLFTLPTVGSNFQTITLYTEFFFMFGGPTLLLDDLPDMSMTVNRALNQMMEKVRNSAAVVQSVHLGSSLITLYVSLAVFSWFIEGYVSMSQRPLWSLSYLIFMVSLLINSVWGIIATKKQIWFRGSLSL